MKFKSGKIQSWIIIGLAVLAVGLLGYVLWNKFSGRMIWKNGAATSSFSYIYFSRLTGEGVTTAAEESPEVVGIMIDNHPLGRPHFGLAAASVVYEAPVEGGLTRFLAIYPRTSTIPRVGPVRSARPYYLDWLREYGDTLYLHCGGSPEALDLIKQENIFDANEFYRGPYFWRDSTYHEAPHNLFTSSELWQKIFDRYGTERQPFFWNGWKFGALVSSTPIEAIKEIKIKYFADYEVDWKYDAQLGQYVRWFNGTEYLDAESKPALADNVLIQFTEMRTIDEVGRRQITTIGTGEGRVLRGGIMIRGTWKKENPIDRTRFYDVNNQEIPLSPGQTWVEVVPANAMIEVTN